MFWLNTTKPQLSLIRRFINKESTSNKFRHLLSLLLNLFNQPNVEFSMHPSENVLVGGRKFCSIQTAQ